MQPKHSQGTTRKKTDNDTLECVEFEPFRIAGENIKMVWIIGKTV